MSTEKYPDPWRAEKLQEIMDRWDAAKERLTKRFPYDEKEDRPDIFRGLIHDGNGAYNSTRVSLDETLSLRVRWGSELSWFVRIAEYVLEKEPRSNAG